MAEGSIVREMTKTFELNKPSSSYNILEAFEIVSKDVTDVTEPLMARNH